MWRAFRCLNPQGHIPVAAFNHEIDRNLLGSVHKRTSNFLLNIFVSPLKIGWCNSKRLTKYHDLSEQLQPLMYTTNMTWVVWVKLISFALQPQIYRNCAHIQACTESCWSIHTFEEQNWYPLQSSKSWINRDLSTCFMLSHHLVISYWYGCHLA